MSEVHCDVPADELSRVAALFAAEPNLDPEEVRALMERVPVKSCTASNGPPPHTPPSSRSGRIQ